MSDASDLIENAEQEAGCRFDDPDNPAAMWGIIGALAREMGVSKFDKRDDVAVGAYIANAPSLKQEHAEGMLAALSILGGIK